jgi:hypothetical protein
MRWPDRFPWLRILLALQAGTGWRVSRADEEHLRDTSTQTATCLTCHTVHPSHAVDVDYEQAVSSGRHDLRAASEVVRRGLLLPGGRVSCHTCHDANSHWKYRIVIPPGSQVRAAVVRGDSKSYGPSQPSARAMTLEEAKATLPSGYAVSPKPLCLVCHATE